MIDFLLSSDKIGWKHPTKGFAWWGAQITANYLDKIAHSGQFYRRIF